MAENPFRFLLIPGGYECKQENIYFKPNALPLVEEKFCIITVLSRYDTLEIGCLSFFLLI
jgi:hypothetical protein